MSLIESVGSKLRATNDALSSAQKAWRDEKLSERALELDRREQVLREKEQDLDERIVPQLQEMRRLEGRKVYRRLLNVLLVVGVAVPSFIAGAMLPDSSDSTADKLVASTREAVPAGAAAASSEADSETAPPEAAPAPDETEQDTDEPLRLVGDATDIESSSRSMGFEDCLSTIAQVSTDLWIAPNNIVETSGMRVVRFNTTEGSVLVSCSALTDKMVLTKSPWQAK